MTDKFARYNLLVDLQKTHPLRPESKDLLDSYTWMHIRDILEERRHEKKLRRLILWVREKVAFLKPSGIPSDIVYEAALRINRDIYELSRTRYKIFFITSGGYVLNPDDQDDLAKITDLYNQHRNPPKV